VNRKYAKPQPAHTRFEKTTISAPEWSSHNLENESGVRSAPAKDTTLHNEEQPAKP
jgi:hypothetical protein